MDTQQWMAEAAEVMAEALVNDNVGAGRSGRMQALIATATDGTDTPARPRRRHTLDLAIEADSINDLIGCLNSLAFELSAGQIRDWSISGGYSTSYRLIHSVDESITHDSWFAALQAYLAAEDAQTGEEE